MKTTKETRYHKKVGDQVVSSYFQLVSERDLKKLGWPKMDHQIHTVAAAVGSSIAANNGWWNGLKTSTGYNKMTGHIGAASFVAIENAIWDFVFSSPGQRIGLSIIGTDARRKAVYRKLAVRAVRKYGADHIQVEPLIHDGMYIVVTK